jgi:transposase
LLGISKRGNKELRELFVHVARAVIWRDGTAERYFGSWLIDLKRRKPFTSKLARIAWSVMVTHKAFEIRV